MANLLSEKWPFIQNATDEVQEICEKAKLQIQEKLMRNSETFAALQYKCVGGFPGVYYLVKIYVGNDECVHAMLSLSSEESNGLNVFAVKGYMRRDDELEPLKIELPEK